MIDEQLRGLLDFSPARFQRQMKDGTVKQLSGMDVFNEALTAIYEIGLEVIGKDEKLLSIQDCPDLESANAVLAKNKLMVVRNKLRFEQRYAWAKACGVAEK